MDMVKSELKRLHQQLAQISIEDFGQIESEAFMLLYRLSDFQRLDYVVAF